MTARTDRRGLSLRNLLFSDPYRKLLALALALGLWFYLDEQVSDRLALTLVLDAVPIETATEAAPDELPLPLPLGMFSVEDFRHADTDEVRTTVTLYFEGPKARIAELQRDHHFRVKPRDIDLDVTSIEFGADDIDEREPYLDMLTGMQPARIKVNLEALTEIEVIPNEDTIVWPDELYASLGNRLQTKRATLRPPVATIEGPASVINQSRNPRFLFELTGQEKFLLTGTLSLITNEPRIRLIQRPVVSVPLEPERRTFTIELPVLVDDGKLPAEARATWDWEPAAMTMTATIEAYGDIVSRYLMNAKSREDLASNYMRLIVTLEPDDRDNEEVAREATLSAHKLVDIDADEYRLKEAIAVTVRRRAKSPERGDAPVDDPDEGSGNR